MRKKEQTQAAAPHTEAERGRAMGAAEEMLLTADAETTALIHRLLDENRRIKEMAAKLPPTTPEQIHAIIHSGRHSQLYIRRQADRYLLTFCLMLLALTASILWRTAAAGATVLNVGLVCIAATDGWVALRAARSLWLMWLTRLPTAHPYRMARFDDRLLRLSQRRRRWLEFVVWGGRNAWLSEGWRSLRIPSYAISACFLLLITINSHTALTTPRDYTEIATTSASSNSAICTEIRTLVNNI